MCREPYVETLQCHSTRLHQEVPDAMARSLAKELSFIILSVISAIGLSQVLENAVTSSSTAAITSAGCRINVNGHLKKNSRLILHPDSSSTDGYRFFLPAAGQNYLTFQHLQEVVFACPNGMYERARCHTGDTFQFIAATREASAANITCKRPLRASVRNLGRCFNNEYNHLGIGISIRQDQSTHEFIKLIDVCFNPQVRISVYAKFTLMQGVENSQKNVKRSTFNCTPYFGYRTEQFDEILGRQKQYQTLANLLGSTNQTDKFIKRNASSDLYLTKGHLVAFKDFVYNSKQQATSFCINTAPMWQVMRKGNWRNLEDSIRQYASRKGKDLTIYSGTYGVLKLPHENGTFVPIYLGSDEDGKDVLPVPELFWKVVYDRLMRQGIVFLGVNNHHNNLNPDVCTDIGNGTESWFNGWNRFNTHLGYVYSCTVREFLLATNVIPEFRDIVIGLLT